METDNPVYTRAAVRGLGAAVLQTWGCPTTPGQGPSNSPERLAHVGVAFASRVVAGKDGAVHDEQCPSARAASPVRRGQLLGPWGPVLRHCDCRGEVEAHIATDGSPMFVAEVKRLLAGLDSACRSCKPFPLSPVEGEMEAVDAARQVLKALAWFRDVAVAPPGFSQVVDATEAAFTAFVTDRVRRLQHDGLRRLAEALVSRVDAQAVALADSSVPHGTASVACVLVGLGRLNAGVVEASKVSVVRQGQLFLEEDTAVVVVPRRLAVLLQAWLTSGVADVMDGTVTLCRPVDSLAPRLREVGAVTLQLMADGRIDAATAWDAALAASV